jgi:hypothetical protein
MAQIHEQCQRYYINGGESGGFGNASPTTGAITLQAVTKRTGNYAFRVQAVSGASSSYQMASSDNNSPNQAYFRGYLYVASRPAALTRTIVALGSTSATNQTPTLRLRADGRIEVTHGAGFTVLGATTDPIPLNTWTLIEIGADHLADTVSLRVNGIVELDWTTLAGMSQLAINGYLGPSDTVADTYDVYWDDLAIDGATWCGPGRVVAIRPTGAGHLTDAGFAVTGAASKWQALIDDPTDDATSYVTTTAINNATESYDIESLPGDAAAIRGVYYRIRARRNAGTNGLLVGYFYRKVWSSSEFVTMFTTSSWQWFESNRLNIVSSFPGEGRPRASDWSEYRLAIRVGTTQASDVSTLLLEVDYDDTVGATEGYSRLVVTGFETGDVPVGSSLTGTAAVQSVEKRTGNFALRVNPVGNTASHMTLPSSLGTGQLREIFFHFALNVKQRPQAGSYARILVPTSSVAIRIDSDGKLLIQDANAALSSPSVSALALDTWYTIDVRFLQATTATANDGEIEILVDGAAFLSSASVDTNSGSNPSGAILGTNLAPGASGVDMVFDDFVTDSTRWVEQTSKIVKIPIVGVGSLSDAGYTSGSVAALPLWEMVDEDTADDDTTYILTPANSNVPPMTLDLADLTDPDDEVRFLQVSIRGKRDAAANGSISYGLYQDPRFVVNSFASTAAYTWSAVEALEPLIQGAFSREAVNDMEFYIDNADADQTRLTIVVVEAEVDIGDFTPVAIGPGARSFVVVVG